MPNLVPNEAYELQKEQFNDSLAQVATATMMAQSLSMCLERKHLVDINKSQYFELVKRADATKSLLNTRWIKVCQIGRPVNENINGCFEAMQNILQSCAIPQTKLLFLITGNGKAFNLYIGAQGNEVEIMDFQSDVNNFVNISWTGISCKAVKEGSDLTSNVDLIKLDPGIETRYLSEDNISALFKFGKDERPADGETVEINHLTKPVMIQYYNDAVRNWE